MFGVGAGGGGLAGAAALTRVQWAAACTRTVETAAALYRRDQITLVTGGVRGAVTGIVTTTPGRATQHVVIVVDARRQHRRTEALLLRLLVTPVSTFHIFARDIGGLWHLLVAQRGPGAPTPHLTPPDRAEPLLPSGLLRRTERAGRGRQAADTTRASDASAGPDQGAPGGGRQNQPDGIRCGPPNNKGTTRRVGTGHAVGLDKVAKPHGPDAL